MTKIANVRQFNGTSDEIQLVASDYNGVTWGPLTFAAIVKRDDAGTTGFQWFLSLVSSTGDASFGRNATYSLALWNKVTSGVTDFVDMFNQTDGWSLIAITKTDGSSVIRGHRYRYSDRNTVHDDSPTAIADPGNMTSASMWLGTYDGASEWFQGQIACAAIWPTTALTDAQIESLADNIASWESLSPAGLWLLDQASEATSVTDRIGAGDQTAINGTTAISVSDLPFYVDDIGITVDQHTIGENAGNSVSSLTLTTTQPVAVGATIILYFSYEHPSAQTLVSIAGGGLTWNLLSDNEGNVGNYRLGIYGAYAPSGLASGTGITMTLSASAPGLILFGSSFLGVHSTSPLDVAQIGFDANPADPSSTWSTDTLTTTQDGDLIVACCMEAQDDARTSGPLSNYNETHQFGANADDTWTAVYRIAGAAGNYIPGGIWDNAAFNGWAAASAALKLQSAEKQSFYISRSRMVVR